MKGENLHFFFLFVFPGMTGGFGNAVEDNLPTKFQRHGASEALLTGASPPLFFPSGARQGRFISRYAATEAPEEERGVHRPKSRGARSGGKGRQQQWYACSREPGRFDRRCWGRTLLELLATYYTLCGRYTMWVRREVRWFVDVIRA